MQELGPLPKEIMSELAPGIELDADGLPAAPGGEQCCALDRNETMTTQIRDALDHDKAVSSLLPYLRDPVLPQDEEMEEALQPF
jgi:hypothetical protein